MKQVKCSKCGTEYYFYSNPICPHCGRNNSDQLFETYKIPKNVSQLKKLYKECELPDEEDTRLFIDEDNNEPNAFGVYEENGEYIVYKNKDDGNRTVYYKGPNEVFATKWAYTKLKKLIPKPKKKEKPSIRRPIKETIPDSPKQEKKESPSEYRATKEEEAHNHIVIAVSLAVFILGSLTISFISSYNRYKKYQAEPKSYEYYRDAQGNFYRMDDIDWDVYNWYVLNTDTGEWEFYESFDEEKFPENLDYTMITHHSTIEEETGLAYDDFYFYSSKAYIDNHRYHYQPDSSYYLYDDRVYYYLDDEQGGYSNDNPNLSGWYIFNEENNDWLYYADFDDRDYFDDEFWYYYKHYNKSYSDIEDYLKSVYGDDYRFEDYNFESTDYYLSCEESVNDSNE